MAYLKKSASIYGLSLTKKHFLSHLNNCKSENAVKKNNLLEYWNETVVFGIKMKEKITKTPGTFP